MNIAVLGSNCKFSSDLAVKLNNLMQSSLVYRYDVLADFKSSVPLYKSLLDNSKGEDKIEDLAEPPGLMNNEPIKRKVKPSALGEYIGDIETSFIRIPNGEEELKKFKLLESMYNLLDTKVDSTAESYSVKCIRKKLKENRRNSELFSATSLNIVNVYSGIINFDMLDLLVNHDPLTIIVKIRGNNGFLPCIVTEEQLNKLVGANPQSVVLDISSMNELLTNEFFISTFNLNKKKESKKKEEPKSATQVYMEQNAQLPLANPFVIGNLVQMAA